jgi:hypothetical protein
MNVYVVVGVVEFIGTTTCDECGQDWHRERDEEVRFQVQASDEDEAKDNALAQAKLQIEEDYTDIEWVAWADKPRSSRPTVEFVREVTETERMKELGAPMLFEVAK